MSVSTPVQVWSNCLTHLKEMVSDQSYRTWFRPIKPVRLMGDVLTIQVPNQFFYEYIEEHFVRELKQSVRAELGPAGRLEYQILLDKEKKGEGNGNGHSMEDDMTPGTFSPRSIKNPFVIPGIQKTVHDPQLKAEYCFENFIEGDCNRLARNAAMAVADKPGGTSFNPLVIYGDVGLGKTHLAQAVGNGTLDNFPRKNVIYVSCEKFTNQIIHSIRHGSTTELVNFYQMLDLLIVDDIQFLSGKEKTQEVFFHIFNQLHQNGKQLILTSDRAPKDLEGMETRLISRFKWGLSADLQAPEFETRMAILESKAAEEEIELPKEVKEFICYNIKDNIRELEGVLVSLGAQASLNKRAITNELARDVIRQFIQNTKQEITVDHIKKHVSAFYGMSTDTIESKSRKREIVQARQIAMYLCHQLTKNSLKAIGIGFGGRDHTTVLYSCRAVEDMMDTDKDFKDTMAELKKQVEMSIS